MKEYIDFWKRGFDFDGVSTRREYWMAWLFDLILITPTYFIALNVEDSALSWILLFALLLYCIFAAIPNIAITVRRLHDSNKSGAWLFIGFIPYIGGFILFIMMCQATVVEGNLYGYHT